ncbi:helix-turn-helix domain-containing protein [Gordonia phosphorivorans]|uniref:Helix-turn-helix domain-containing protein n=1 Tax=Gordonia phosphorivorans TaxID=1056982 RepID=A0ABV6H7T2_9ACTN
MEEDTERLARAIGERVKRERNAKSWTLDQLAAKATLSRRMVVNVEQGATNPSLGTLLRLSAALGVGLPTLVEEPPSPVGTVIRHGDGAVLWTGTHGGRAVLVAGTESPDIVELWDWTLGPGDVHSTEAHAPGTRELLRVDSGELTVQVEDHVHRLGPGDALSFRADAAHSYANHTDALARFTLAVYEPGIGGAHRAEHSDA